MRKQSHRPKEHSGSSGYTMQEVSCILRGTQPFYFNKFEYKGYKLKGVIENENGEYFSKHKEG